MILRPTVILDNRQKEIDWLFIFPIVTCETIYRFSMQRLAAYASKKIRTKPPVTQKKIAMLTGDLSNSRYSFNDLAMVKSNIDQLEDELSWGGIKEVVCVY